VKRGLRSRHASIKGFTLIELLVVLAILGLLAALATPVAQVTVQRSREQDLRIALREIRTAIDAFKKASDEGRIIKRADASGYPESLEQLVEGVDDAKDPKKRRIYFLRRIPPDPMYAGSAENPAATWGKRSYESEPAAPREGDDVYDVYSRSARSGLNGVAYNKW
jgi:general secretion pathway protein G